MAFELDRLPARAALAEIAGDFHARGWMAGTAGNLSARDDENHFWITASGRPKGRLEESDFLLLRIDSGEIAERASADNKPSAEASIHRAIYGLFPDARACLHVHSVDACIAANSAKSNAKTLRLPPLEMIKGFDIWEQNPRVDLPLFENHAEVLQIASEIHARFSKTRPAIGALMVRGHGVTVWGASLQQAYNRVETMEFIMSYMAR
jgi:methylthioribulose-1-phosphate dehydratase